jgi:hypothetical protein
MNTDPLFFHLFCVLLSARESRAFFPPDHLVSILVQAISVFYHLYESLGFVQPTTTQQDFHAAVLSVCQMTEQELIEKISARVRNRTDLLTILCFEAMFVDKLLVDQYKITGQEFKRIEFMKQIPVRYNFFLIA